MSADSQVSSLRRGLKARHMSMIAIGGSIGTGLFLASGAIIASAGPGSALAAYALIGVMVQNTCSCCWLAVLRSTAASTVPQKAKHANATTSNFFSMTNPLEYRLMDCSHRGLHGYYSKSYEECERVSKNFMNFLFCATRACRIV